MKTTEKKNEENINILNQMPVIKIKKSKKYDSMYFVENNEENIKLISKIVSNPEQVLNEWFSDSKYINITALATENCGATSFENNKFI